MIRKAIITAAGRGTRQYPASKTVQKELFPLVDIDGFTKPALQIIAEECLNSGIDEICIVANPHNVDAIRAHFSPPSEAELQNFAGKEWAVELAKQLTNLSQRITIVIQVTQEGFGHAIYQARDWANGEPVLILLGDHVYLADKGLPNCSAQMIAAYEKFAAPISSVVSVPEDMVTRLGVIEGEMLDTDSYKVISIVEKPTIEQARNELSTPGLAAGYFLAHFGIHVFPNSIFDKLQYLIDNNIRRKNEFQLTSGQELLMRDSPLYVAQRIHGRRFDIGQPDELIITQIALAMASKYKGHIEEALKLGYTVREH